MFLAFFPVRMPLVLAALCTAPAVVAAHAPSVPAPSVNEVTRSSLIEVRQSSGRICCQIGKRQWWMSRDACTARGGRLQQPKFCESLCCKMGDRHRMVTDRSHCYARDGVFVSENLCRNQKSLQGRGPRAKPSSELSRPKPARPTGPRAKPSSELDKPKPSGAGKPVHPTTKPTTGKSVPRGNCKPEVVGGGSDFWSTRAGRDRALVRARNNWRKIAGGRYGDAYAKLRKARNRGERCELMQDTWHCVVAAYPCK